MKMELEAPHVLACREIWGGNEKVVRRISLPGLEGWVASQPLDSGAGGGDVHYVSVCDVDVISRIALADVSGHGREVSRVTRKLLMLMRENVNVWDQSDFMRGLNEEFRQSADGKYATAVILSYNRVKGRLAFTNAGHLPPLWYHASEKRWGWLEEEPAVRSATVAGLPVGLIPGTDYQQTVLDLPPLDLLVLYTDGITEAEDEAGHDLGRDEFLQWAREAPVNTAAAIGEALLQRLETFRSVAGDDETLLVLQRQVEARPKVLTEIAVKYVARKILNPHS
jgi:sigma-B regulation protein RsbU (phosphoserine phosphatase)